MNFLVISDAPILTKYGKLTAYAPYVKEMDIWTDLVDHAHFVCPIRYKSVLFTKAFKNQDSSVVGLKRLEFNSLLSAVISLLIVPYQAIVLWSEMRNADHIHLRCPGNIGLLGCIIQILFPNKKKTAKYAGNWDPKAKQPLSYKIQKWLLSNTFLTRNMQVLVYGEWKGMSTNVQSFFTASYFESEKKEVPLRDFKTPLKALFVGTMGENKRPFETAQLIRSLRRERIDISLEMYGEGEVSEDIKWYRKENGLRDHILLRGNRPATMVKEAYQKADVVILLSKSEGWPKVVAEAMFWGAIPIVSNVSCVPWMIGNGERGILIENPEKIDIKELKNLLLDSTQLQKMSTAAMTWSRQYTMDTFTKEIEKLL